MHSVETVIPILNFALLPGKQYAVDTLLWCWAGQQVAAPSQEGKQPIYIYSHSVPRQPAVFHFQYSIQLIAWDIQHFIIKQVLC